MEVSLKDQRRSYNKRLSDIDSTFFRPIVFIGGEERKIPLVKVPSRVVRECSSEDPLTVGSRECSRIELVPG